MRLKKLAAYAAHALGTGARIAGDPRGAGRRATLLATYLRLRLKRLLHLPMRTGATERVAGFRVAAFDYFTLDFLFNEIFLGHQYHFTTDAPAPLVVDCGSNVGMSVLYFKALHPRARILAFEPGEAAHRQLVANVHANGLRDVTVHRAALAGRDGTITFYDDPGDPGSVLMSAFERALAPAQRACEVPAVRLSRFIDGPVDFLKLDVEGAEHDVLQDLQRHDRLRFVEQMVIEYHHHMRADDDRLSELLRVLETSGFGYQLACPERPRARGEFQDVQIYAYRKPVPAPSPLAVPALVERAVAPG